MASDGAAGEAAVIATFFAERPGPEPLPHHAKLYRCLAGAAETAEVPFKFRNHVHGVILDRFVPSARGQQDVTVVQLVLNATGTTAEAWDRLRQRLERLLDNDDLRSVLGYSLIYQAATSAGVEPEQVLEACLPAARRPGGMASTSPLAHAVMPGGNHLWLVDVPTAGDGLAAATVYVALSPLEEEDAFVKTVLLARNGASGLLVPDLIAHKGYHQVRGYEEMKGRLEGSTEGLKAATSRMLDERGRQVPAEAQLAALAREHDRLAPLLPDLIDGRISLLKQEHNFDLWQEGFGTNGVLAFHRRFLETGRWELGLAEESARGALEAAGYAVSVAQAQIHWAQETHQERIQQAQAQAQGAERRRQQRAQVLIAVLGIGLAFAQLIDQRVAAELLLQTGWPDPTRKVELGAPESGYSPLLLFLIRFVLTIALAGLSWVILRAALVIRRRRARVGGASPATGTVSQRKDQY